MNRSKLFLFFSVFSVVAGFWWLGRPAPSLTVPIEKKKPSFHKGFKITGDTLRPKQPSPKKVLFNEKAAMAIKKDWEGRLLRIQARDKKCLLSAKKLIDKELIVDVNNNFFKKPQKVLDHLWDVYTETLLRIDAEVVFRDFSQTLQSHDVDPQWAYDYLSQLEICRPADSLQFIESVFEACQTHKWGRKSRQELIFLTLGLVENSMGTIYTSENLNFSFGIIYMLMDYDILPKSLQVDVQAMDQRLKELDGDFASAFNKEEGKIENLALLREDLLLKEEISLEFLELVKAYRREYASSVVRQREDEKQAPHH